MQLLYILFFFFILFKKKCHALTTIRSVGFSFYDTYQPMVANLFNEYAKQNNIDIRMEAIVYNIENSTREMDDIWSSIDHLLNKQSTKYDIIFYDVIYSQRYSQHLLDLKKWLSEKHMNLYSGVTAKEVGKVDDKWVGLVAIFYAIRYIILQ